MGVTAIKRVLNQSNATVKVLDLENTHATGHDVDIAPGDELETDMWIPWAPNEGDFRAHHLEVARDGQTIDWIWQAQKNDGDFIRFSTDGEWHDPGELAPGLSHVDGDRWLTVTDSGFDLIPPSRPAPWPNITAITKVFNRSDRVVDLLDKEGPQEASVKPGALKDLKMWIPWAPTRHAFDQHHLELGVDGTTVYWIWQAAQSDRDVVRYSSDGQWHNPGDPVQGLAGVGGDRWLLVFNDHFELAQVQEDFDGTHIQEIDNTSSKPVAVVDVYDSSAEGSGTSIASGASLSKVDMAVPWAWSAAVFPMRHLRVDIDGQPSWWIWRAPGADGDFVRYSNEPTWTNSGGRLIAPGPLRLEVGVDYLKAELIHQSPPLITHGVQTISLTKENETATRCTAFATPLQRRVMSVKNTAQPIGGGGFKIDLTHVTTAGAEYGPIPMAFGYSVGEPFLNQPVDGEWIADVYGYPFQIPDSGITIDVAWQLDPEAPSANRVEYTEKDTGADPDRVIQAIGGRNPDGSIWRLPIDEAIENVLAGVRYYIEDPEERAYLEVASRGHHRYLKTINDPASPNLRSLPEPPESG